MKAPRRRSLGLRSALALVVIYGAVTLWARSISDSMLFLPDYGSRVEPAGSLRIEVGDGTTVSAVYLPNPAARFTMWYFHGNAEALGDLTPRLEKLRELGFAVFAENIPATARVAVRLRSARSTRRIELRLPICANGSACRQQA